ncbi:hypothetical protein B0H11DRAFT_2245563 [Mycena galericulata]|nr:hypothetical protein B0H11DRAFT_2245563 [Mycena galericulata]
MDSQITLVNPSPPVCLTFSVDSMINATLFLGSRPTYKLSTKLQGTTTIISAVGTSALLARITRREVLPSTVIFPNVGDGKEMRVSSWMKRCKLEDGSEARIIETGVGKCFLKRDRTYRLALYSEYDLNKPVAHWKCTDSASPLSLILYPGTEDFHAQIIVAFITEELKMRSLEKYDGVALSRAAAHELTVVDMARP